MSARKRPARDWTVLLVFALGVTAAGFAGAYIASRWVSPCVCVLAQAAARIN